MSKHVSLLLDEVLKRRHKILQIPYQLVFSPTK